MVTTIIIEFGTFWWPHKNPEKITLTFQGSHCVLCMRSSLEKKNAFDGLKFSGDDCYMYMSNYKQKFNLNPNSTPNQIFTVKHFSNTWFNPVQIFTECSFQEKSRTKVLRRRILRILKQLLSIMFPRIFQYLKIFSFSRFNKLSWLWLLQTC